MLGRYGVGGILLVVLEGETSLDFDGLGGGDGVRGRDCGGTYLMGERREGGSLNFIRTFHRFRRCNLLSQDRSLIVL
jgi:hypothetical protein